MSKNDLSKEMAAFLYKYKCNGYIYPYEGTNSFIHKEGNDPQSEAIEDAKRLSGSSECQAALMQKFFINIRLGEPYEAMFGKTSYNN